jgi:hypothetical protein
MPFSVLNSFGKFNHTDAIVADLRSLFPSLAVLVESMDDDFSTNSFRMAVVSFSISACFLTVQWDRAQDLLRNKMITGAANPFDPEWNDYFQERKTYKMLSR